MPKTQCINAIYGSNVLISIYLKCIKTNIFIVKNFKKPICCVFKNFLFFLKVYFKTI